MASEQRPSYATLFETVRGVGSLLAPDDFKYLTEIPAGAPDSQLVIHLSCMAHYTPHIPVLAQKILQKIDLDCVIVGGPENCCGELHKHFKDHDLERQAAKGTLFGFRKLKPRKVVSICPDCYDVFSSHGADRQPYQYSNISDLFIEYLPVLKAKMRPVNMRIIPHFHTVNGARRADADNMMTILRAIPGVEIIEAHHALGPGNHCQTLHPMLPPDQERMFAEAKELGAGAIVVPYHSCYRQHCKMQLKYDVAVHHMFNLLAMSLGIPFTEPFKEMRLMDDVDAVINALRPRIEHFGYDETLVRAQVKRAIFC
jgi:Fe-S oxidoreductase